MADDQGVTTGTDTIPDGHFARSVTGKQVKQDITNLDALLARTGPDTKGLAVLDAPPTNPQDGDLALADGTNWDPDSDGVAGYELVIYANGAWTEIIGGL